jgi:hypothetical protein
MPVADGFLAGELGGGGFEGEGDFDEAAIVIMPRIIPPNIVAFPRRLQPRELHLSYPFA